MPGPSVARTLRRPLRGAVHTFTYRCVDLKLYVKCNVTLQRGNEIGGTCKGAVFTVALTVKVSKLFGRLGARERAGLDRWMKILANSGKNNIPTERLRFEERFPIGRSGDEVAVFALKDFQTRLYGGPVQGMQPPTYLFTEIDVAKKQDKADRTKLQRAAELLYEHYIKT